MTEESHKILSESGYIHPFYGRTIYMNSEKQQKFFRFHIAELKKNSKNYNKVSFGKDKLCTTTDMVIPLNGIFRRIYITYYPEEIAKEKFRRHANKVNFGVFTFHSEVFPG